MVARDAERARARFGLAVLAGVFLTPLSGAGFLPWLGYPFGFVAAAVTGALFIYISSGVS
jgi:hypothetical protein